MRTPSPSLFTLLITAGIVAALPSAASAQDNGDDFDPEGGVYVSVKGGITSPSDETFSGTQAPAAGSPGVQGAPADIALQFGEDVTFAGTIGYRIPKRVFGLIQPSIEAEYSYARNDVSGGALNGGNQIFDGDVDVNTFTIGYRSEFRWAKDQKIIPFTGGAIGIAEVDSNVTYFPDNGVANAPTFGLSGSDTGFVLQSNLGVTVPLTEKVELDLSGRYQRISGIDLERRFIADGNDAFNADVSGRHETVSGFLGLRYRF